MPSTDVLMSRESRPGVPLVSITVLSGFCGRGSSIRQGPSSQDASSVIVAAVGHTQQPVPRAGLGCAGLTASARKPCQRVEVVVPCSEARDGLPEGRRCAPHLLSALSPLFLLRSVKWP